MTRQQFAALAAALARTRPNEASYTQHSVIGNNTMFNGIAHGAALAQWQRTREAVSLVLAGDNPRFDKGRFYIATES